MLLPHFQFWLLEAVERPFEDVVLKTPHFPFEAVVRPFVEDLVLLLHFPLEALVRPFEAVWKHL